MSRTMSQPGPADGTRWGEWRHDSNIPANTPRQYDDDWRLGEIAKIQREIETSRVEEERLAQELHSNERVLRHNLNELRHWKAAIQSRDEELVRRHRDDCERMNKFMAHNKMRLEKERSKLLQPLLKCVQSSRRISAVLESCAACEYELTGQECPDTWGDRFPVEPSIFERCIRAAREEEVIEVADDAAGLIKETLPEAPQWGLGGSASRSLLSDGRSSIDPDNFRPSGSHMNLPPGDPARDSGFANLNMRQPIRGGGLALGTSIGSAVSVGVDGRRSSIMMA